MTRSGWTSANSGPDYRAGDDEPVTIAGFLSARLDDDEKTANGLHFAARIPDKVPDFCAAGGPAAEQFWGIFDPARVLREVAAKRAILAEHAPAEEGWLAGDYVRCQRCRGEDRPVSRTESGGIAAWPCGTILALAAVWSDHPDYDPAWRPE